MPGKCELTVGERRCAVKLELIAQGRDLLLRLTGGEAHIGAVALSSPTSGPDSGSETRLLVVGRHREGPIAAEAAERLCRASGRVVAVLAGIHIDDATPPELEAILANVRAGLEKLETRLGVDRPGPSGGVDGGGC